MNDSQNPSRPLYHPTFSTSPSLSWLLISPSQIQSHHRFRSLRKDHLPISLRLWTRARNFFSFCVPPPFLSSLVVFPLLLGFWLPLPAPFYLALHPLQHYSLTYSSYLSSFRHR